MTKPAPVHVATPTHLRAAFDFHAVPFTREIATDHHLRLPFLDEALAGLLAAVGARMPAALTAPAGTGKTALLRRLHDGPPDARAFAPVVGPDGGLPQTPTRSSTTKGRSR
jgi:hypothetical protein